MSLSAAQIFVRTDDLAAVIDQCIRALSGWSADVGTLPPGGPALERRLVVLPPVKGCVTILEEGARADRLLARDLHSLLGCDVARVDLDGHFLSGELEVHAHDGRESSWSSPLLPSDPEHMPLYEDVEAELFGKVLALDLPAGLLGVDWEDLTEPDAPLAHGLQLHVVAGDPSVRRRPLPFGELDAGYLASPRVRPDLWVESPDGRAEVVEARRLSGEWHPEALVSLVRVEESQLRRIVPALAWTAEGALAPRVRFAYEGMDEPEAFAQALEVVRSRRPLVDLLSSGECPTIVGVVDALRRVSAGTGFLPGRICGRRLEVRHRSHPAWHFFMDLDALWSQCLTPLPADGMVALLEELLPCVDRPFVFDPSRLWPLLLSSEEAGIEPLASRPLFSGIRLALAVDVGEALVPVTRAMLREANLGLDEAVSIAVGRLEVATEENDEFVLFEQPEGITISAEFPDVSSAARILSEAVLAHLAQQLGDECVVAVPSRDVLLAAEGTPEARRWLAQEVVARFRGAEHPLSTLVWTVCNGELVEELDAARALA